MVTSFSNNEVKTMSSAVGSIIKWPIHLLVPYKEGLHSHFEHVEELQDASFVQDSWRKKRVHLWNEAKMQKLEEGVVLLVHPYEAINSIELGDSHLGIILDKPLHSLLDVSCHSMDLPQLHLISWPLNQLTFENGKSLKSIHYNVDTTCINDKDVFDEHLL